MDVTYGDWVVVGKYDATMHSVHIELDNAWDVGGAETPIYGLGFDFSNSGIDVVDITWASAEWPLWYTPPPSIEPQQLLWKITLNAGMEGHGGATGTYYWWLTEPVGTLSSNVTITLKNMEHQRIHGLATPVGRVARKPEDNYAVDQWMWATDGQIEVSITNVYDGAGVLQGTVTLTGDMSEFAEEEIGVGYWTNFDGQLRWCIGGHEYIRMTISGDGDVPIPLDGFSFPMLNYDALASSAGNVVTFEGINTNLAPWPTPTRAYGLIYSPYIIDCSNWHIYDSVGHERNDVVIDAFGITDTIANFRAASPIIWQGVSWKLTPVCNWEGKDISGNATVSVFINQAWAEANNEPIDDIYIFCDVGGADWDGDGSPYRDALVITHLNTLDPMKPPGLSTRPTTWVGSNGVTVV